VRCLLGATEFVERFGMLEYSTLAVQG
jgi:hypothetical protein